MVKNFKSKFDKRQRQIASSGYLREVVDLLENENPTANSLKRVQFSKKEFENHYKERVHFQECAAEYETYDYATSILYKKSSEKLRKSVIQKCKEQKLTTLKEITSIARLHKKEFIWVDPRFKVSNYWCSKHIKPHLGLKRRARKWSEFMVWLDNRMRTGIPLYSEEVVKKYESGRRKNKSTRKTSLRHIRQRLNIKLDKIESNRTLWKLL